MQMELNQSTVHSPQRTSPISINLTTHIPLMKKIKNCTNSKLKFQVFDKAITLTARADAWRSPSKQLCFIYFRTVQPALIFPFIQASHKQV